MQQVTFVKSLDFLKINYYQFQKSTEERKNKASYLTSVLSKALIVLQELGIVPESEFMYKSSSNSESTESPVIPEQLDLDLPPFLRNSAQ
mgnify:CR=1 FL=1